MGLFNFIRSQFIEVIEWTDSSNDTMVYRFPVENKEIKMGAQLTVRPSQIAVFVNEGQIADVYEPGRYKLSTENMPILTKLKSWKYGFNSPFKAEVYFVNTKQFTDRKWGTSNPIMMRDAEFGMLRLRAFGNYSFKVIEPVIFLKEVFGTNELFEVESIEGQLKRSIISGLTDYLAEARIPALDLAMHYDELSQGSKTKLQSRFRKLGLEISSLYIENISLPEEVEKTLDKRTSMGVLGDMGKYAQYQSAEAIRDAAKNEGGLASAGVGIGTGAALGNMMGEAFKSANKENSNNVVEKIKCSNCNELVNANSKFCNSCGNKLTIDKVPCIKCNYELNKGSKFCPECGTKQDAEVKCKNCDAKLSPNSKFCAECGTKQD